MAVLFLWLLSGTPVPFPILSFHLLRAIAHARMVVVEKQNSASRSLSLRTHIWVSDRLFPAVRIAASAGDLPCNVCCKRRLRSARKVSIFILAGHCSVGVEAAASTATTTVAAAVSTTSGRVATRRATVAAAHGRRATVASVRTATTARGATSTAASAAVHAWEIGSLGNDL
jgi:hypothetical protein